MSLLVWPSIAPSDLQVAQQSAHKAELDWLIQRTRVTLRDVKRAIEDCYALTAPIEPGSTLAMTTPHNEKIKGTITRVGARIVKGSLHLQLRTHPLTILTINPAKPIHISPILQIQAALTNAITLLTTTLSDPVTPEVLTANLRRLSELTLSASTIIKGDSDTPTPGVPKPACPSRPSPEWTTASAASTAFDPPLDGSLSVHFTLQDSGIVMTLRALENTDAPVFFGTKLGLAIGTVRRLEHDEMEKPFKYTFNREEAIMPREPGRSQPQPLCGVKPIEVFVREKVRVDSPDPNLMSLQIKLTSVHHTIGQLRQNLKVVMAVCGE